MLSLALVVFCGLAAFLIAKRVAVGQDARLVTWVATGGYALRIGVSLLVRQVSFFSHEGAGDSQQYEDFCWYLVAYWHRTGVHWIDPAEAARVFDSGTILSAPGFVQLFGLIQYFDGDKTRLGMVAINALLASMTFVVTHRFALEVGSRPKAARILSLCFFFSPAFFFYTADSYKDPWVIAFGVGCLYGAYLICDRGVRRGLLLFVGSAAALWFVRRYLVYMLLVPLGAAIVLRLTKRGKNRVLAVTLGLLVGIVALVVVPPMLKDAGETATATYETAIATNTRAWNERGGSGIDFEDGGDPYAKLAPKLLYTLFSPFPWMTGSAGFQIGKLDALLMTATIFFAARALVRRWRDKKREIILILSFVLPASFAYSLTMANIGLIVRQRLVIEIGFLVLGSLSFVATAARRRIPVARRLPAGLAARPRPSVPMDDRPISARRGAPLG